METNFDVSVEGVIAINKINGFAKDGKIPWHCSEDLMWFREKTVRTVCIMGHSTYRSLLDDYRGHRELLESGILPGRRSIVISKTVDQLEGVDAVCNSIEEGIKTGYEILKKIRNEGKEIYGSAINIIGGCQLIYSSLEYIEYFDLSIINDMTVCDLYFDISRLLKQFEYVTHIELSKCLTLFRFKNKNPNSILKTIS